MELVILYQGALLNPSEENIQKFFTYKKNHPLQKSFDVDEFLAGRRSLLILSKDLTIENKESLQKYPKLTLDNLDFYYTPEYEKQARFVYDFYNDDISEEIRMIEPQLPIIQYLLGYNDLSVILAKPIWSDGHFEEFVKYVTKASGLYNYTQEVLIKLNVL